MSLSARFFGLGVMALLCAACNPAGDSEHTSLYTLNLTSEDSQPALLMSDPQLAYWGAAWSPDGTRLAVTLARPGNGQGELYLVNADGGERVQLTHNGRNNYLPAWSPDGQQVAYVSQEGGATSTAEIYTIHVDGTGETRLTDNDAWEYGASWSPDGQTLVFGSRRDDNWQIYTMAADGSNQEPLSTPAQGNAPHWSPDGTLIAFTSNRDGDDDIWVMAPDGASQRNLTANVAWEDNPRWSPDGARIAFASDRGGTADIMVMNADGGEAVNLTDGNYAAVGVPAWSPSGSQLVFHASPNK